MSLKAFHILFIIASTTLAFGFGAWAVKHYLDGQGSGLELALGLASFALGIILIVYGRYFLRKLKDVSYL